MRKILSAVFILLISINVFAQKEKDINPNGYNKFYYENGKVSSEGIMRDSKPDGYWKTYAETGIIKSEGNRKNFMLDSIWKFYDEKGKIMFEYNYKEGKKCGLKKTYDAKEHFLVTSETYDKDVKQGKTVNYYKNGKTHVIIPFVNGKEEGQGFELSPDSTIITITQYKMGFVQSEERINRRSADSLKQGMWKTFYPDGMVKTEVNYADDKMNGYLKEYSAKGSLDKMTKYVNGKEKLNAPELAKLDVKSDYYEGGILKFQGTYKDGVAVGIHREFSKDGKVTGAKVYADGVLTGEGIIDTIGRLQGNWKEYYPGGELKSQGNYDNSKRVGEWVFYYQNGKTEQRGKYDKKGKAQGEWKWYYESGNKWREENYRNNLQDGTMTEYADSGKVITKGEYIDGLKEGPWILELPDYREEGSYKADKRDGEWKEYYTTTNSLRYQGKFVDGVPDGMQKFYYPNGKEKQQGEYQGGNKEGDWYFYDENGFLFLTILFKNDIEVRFDGIKVEPETPLSEPSIK
jgi:antitoxin component YwqK of YwqJK toxin-antitoxin module